MLYKTDQTLIMTGERERLKELLRTRLIECGWRDQIQMLCRDVVRERGVNNLKLDDLIAEVTAKGRALVPDSVKKELLQKIKVYLVQDM
ncbi:Transcription and mRNA export factor ENY2 [Blattella germanica]|nr:Transcription and mRNA export factor ENY2 [Blattella germanica]